MTIRWMTAFIDRPAAPYDEAVQFWIKATGSTLSDERGERGEFATLVPSGGDAYLRVQRVDDGGGSHLDLHVDDIEEFVNRASAAGAHVERPPHVPALVRSPAGMVCCAVPYHGETIRPLPAPSHGGALSLPDQMCIDIPNDLYSKECRFWSELTGWLLQSSTVHPEFKFLIRPAWSPLRVLLQRRDDSGGPARAHLDIACDDVKALTVDHLSIGANITAEFEHWTAMLDPAGLPYCITSRDPHIGLRETPVPDFEPAF
jgi:catechol 2,3-dioxygenase-like lactoylglutathione lyase family enzyme